jgi:thimet oligopeptidase
VQGQLLYSTYSLQLHDADPATLDFEALWREDELRFNRFEPVDGMHDFASYYHVTVYSSNYYTYVLDKVIALDFFAQFDPKHMLDGPAAMRYRRSVLEPGGSKPASELINTFLGRDHNIDGLKTWMAQEDAKSP